MFQRGWFQIDVKQPDLLAELARVVRQYGPTRSGPLAEAVLDELAPAGRFAGVIVQVDEENLALVERLTERAPGLPILALLGPRQRDQLNVLSARGVSSVLLPLQGASVVSFVQRALTHNFVPNERVASTIAHLATTRALTAREVQLVSYSLGDEPRARVRRRLGITENTLKSQIRSLLRKCGERNLDALAKNVLRSSLLSVEARGPSARPQNHAEPLGDITQESMFSWAAPAE